MRTERGAVLELPTFAITWKYRREAREHEDVVRAETGRAALSKFVENHANDDDAVAMLRITEVTQ